MVDVNSPPPLRFLHIGDLHITAAGLPNHLDLRRIIDEINRHGAGHLDFVVLPGDTANDGSPDQFQIVRDEMARLGVPWRAIPGDHDFKPRSLDAFYQGLGVRSLPYAVEVSGCRCLFLDVVSDGEGGPDFRLGSQQLEWLRRQLDAAARDGRNAVVFMHTYPADLGDYAETLTALFDQAPVRLVDMGHTHYNELANDGRTIYAATRSTGEIEEGEVGLAPAGFRPLGCTIRAAAFGEVPVAEAAFRIDERAWRPMAGRPNGLFAAVAPVPDRPFRLSVRVIDRHGQQDIDVIEVAQSPSWDRRPTGSDAGRIAAWPHRHLLGTQLGPNRNGRKW